MEYCCGKSEQSFCADTEALRNKGYDYEEGIGNISLPDNDREPDTERFAGKV